MIYFILPAYNEKDNLVKLVRDIHEAVPDRNYQIVIVDDGSDDGTAELLDKLKNTYFIRVITHKKNMGLGKALFSGFHFVFERIKPEDCIVTMDSDNTHPPELSKLMLERIREGSDIVIASRFSGGKEIGLKIHRKIFSRVIKMILEIMFPYKGLKDYTCGYRAISGSFLKTLWASYEGSLITEGGFTATVEILLKSLKLNPKISEVPLILRYDMKKGASKMKVFKTILGYFKLIYRLK
jgi:dolichol-phosphate mannosyltransferase